MCPQRCCQQQVESRLVASERREFYVTYIKKSDMSPVHAMKVYRGIKGIVPLISTTGARWEWLTSCLDWFTPGKKTPVPTELEAVLTLETFWMFRRNKFFAHTWFRPPDPPERSTSRYTDLPTTPPRLPPSRKYVTETLTLWPWKWTFK